MAEPTATHQQTSVERKLIQLQTENVQDDIANSDISNWLILEKPTLIPSADVAISRRFFDYLIVDTGIS